MIRIEMLLQVKEKQKAKMIKGVNTPLAGVQVKNEPRVRGQPTAATTAVLNGGHKTQNKKAFYEFLQLQFNPELRLLVNFGIR